MAKYLDETGLRHFWNGFEDHMNSLNYEHVKITINNNQGYAVNISFIVTINGAPTSYTYKNEPITIDILKGSTYTISLPDLTNYTTPVDDNQYVAAGGNSRNLTYTYKACLVTFNINNASGKADVTYGGTTTTVNPGGTLLIPFNQTVSVKGTKVTGYRPQKIENFITNTATKIVNVTYDVFTTEVKIMDGSGNLVDVNSWTSSKGVTGVTLVTEDIEIVIAPDEWSSDHDGAWNSYSLSSWGGDYILVPGVTTTTSESEAISDLCGILNTNALITLAISESSKISRAGEYCRAYSNGAKNKGQWYLPSAGEMYEISINKDKINTALTKISGEIFESSNEIINVCSWTSTQLSSEYAWAFNWLYNQLDDRSKIQNYGVRPICQIEDTTGNIITFKIGGVSYLGEDQMTWSQWVSSSYNTAGFKITNSKLYTSAGAEVKYNNSSVSSSSKPVPAGDYKTSSVKVLLNSAWQASSKSNPDSSTYGIYESYSNKGSGSTAAIMYIDIDGLTEFTCYIRSYAESSYDYVMIGNLDQPVSNSTSYSHISVKAHTRNKQTSGTSLSSYTKVTYTDIGGGAHRIYVVYRKDGSVNEGDDRGYILIPKPYTTA